VSGYTDYTEKKEVATIEPQRRENTTRRAATGGQGRVTVEYAEYAEKKQASGRISAYFAYSAVQPSSGKP